jgi:hypothetical protein
MILLSAGLPAVSAESTVLAMRLPFDDRLKVLFLRSAHCDFSLQTTVISRRGS